MSYRYSSAWSRRSALGRALINAGCWRNAVPRVGNLFPGITTPMPEPANVSFEEACDVSAVEILKKFDDVVVLWSGGIDSTLVACKLLQHKQPHHTIYITTNEQSLEVGSEYLPALLVEGAVQTDFDLVNLLALAERGARIVSGYHADSILVGEFYDNHSIGELIWDISPVDMLRLNAKSMGVLDGVSHVQEMRFAERTLEQLEPLLEHMPVERTAANIGWWLDFSTYWEHDEYELHFRLGLGVPGEGYISFFNTTMFQQWAQQDTRVKVGQNGKHHKYQYTEQIAKVLGEGLAPPKKAIMGDIGWYRPELVDHRLLLIREDYSPFVAGA